jgi:hypothetical protein
VIGVERARTTRGRVPEEAPAPAPPAPTAIEQLIAAQRGAGNHATTQLVARLTQASGPMLQRDPKDADAYRRKHGLPAPHSSLDTVVPWAEYLWWLKHYRSPHFQPLLAELLRGLSDEFSEYVVNRLTDPSYEFVPDEQDEEQEEQQEEEPDENAMQVDADVATIFEPGGFEDDESDTDDTDFVADEPEPYRKPARKRKAAKAFPEENETDYTFRGDTAKKRKVKVKSKMETITLVTGKKIQRPLSMSGPVDPRATTDRGSAPEPPSYRVGVKWKEVGTKPSKQTGLCGAHKGHIMALELGGPDLPWNIVPQWGNWQANGEWRQAERLILKMAEDARRRGRELHFNAEVIYKRYKRPDLATERGLVVPVGFHVQVREETPGVPNIAPWRTIFYGEQHQDETDFKAYGKLFDVTDAADDSDSDSDSD